MQQDTTTRRTRGWTLDRNIERFRQQHARLTSFFMKGNAAAITMEELDVQTERLITEVFGESSEMLDAYEYAQLGETASLVNMLEEAQEGGTQELNHGSLHLRRRVLESCIAELEAGRAAATAKPRKGPSLVIGPQVADHMSPEVRSVSVNATLKQASHLMQQWKIGSLLVTQDGEYVGIITDTDLAREVVARGLDPSKTTVKTGMSTPPIMIEGSQPIIEAVRLMKDKGTRHLAVTENGTIVGILSVSNILRYYSGVV